MPHTYKFPDLPTPAELVREMQRLSRELDKGLGYLHEVCQLWAVAEDAYRMARARAHLQAADALAAEGVDRPTVDEKRAWVDSQTSAERVEAHLQGAMRDAAREAVRSRRTQISALQSAANAVRAEIEMASTGPRT